MVAKKPGKKSQVDRWVELEREMRRMLPHLSSFLTEEDEFVELRVKAQPDGTTLAIAKGYGSDGGPIVCFGSGYGYFACLMAIDATIQGGKWRVDKPWQPGKK